MRALVLVSLLALPAVADEHKRVELTRDEERAVIAAYRALKPPEPESRKLDTVPGRDELARIDVSARMRSASFGHRTWLLVPAGGKQFYVEHGRSTNTPPALFGPFDVKPAAAPSANAPPPPPSGSPR